MHAGVSHVNLKISGEFIKMKNFGKLTLFFCLFFTLILITAFLLRFIASWIDMARIIPMELKGGVEVAGAAWEALSAALYLSILLAISYSARRKMPIFFSIIWIIILSFIFTAGISLGIGRTRAIQSVFNTVPSLKVNPGLIVSQNENTVILLKGSSETKGPRLVSIPGRPLIYQEVPVGPNSSILPLPAISFGNTVPWFIQSINIDLSLNARELENRLGDSYLSFAAYALSLILLLSSMRFLMDLSQWPLASIFLGALIFRLVLSLEIFLNSPEIRALIGSFLNWRIPSMLITPLVFSLLGALALLYTLLARISGIGSKRKSHA